MLIFSGKTSRQGFLSALASFALSCSLIGTGHAQTTPLESPLEETAGLSEETVLESPFKFHDLETNRNEEAVFGNATDEVVDPDAIKKLEYAAEEGSEIAMWKLGRIYSGKVNNRDDQLRAFEFFSRIVRGHRDHTPYSPKASITASALVFLGTYYRHGIPETHVIKNAEQAWSMFLTAATFYGSSQAQFSLFEMCDTAEKEICSDIQAGRWLKKSAINGHIGGQAHFGFRQFEGEKGVRRNKIEGLKWLTIARERAHPAREEWVFPLHEQAFSIASQEERVEARARAEIWMRDYCTSANTC